jgi:hypothetical protein
VPQVVPVQIDAPELLVTVLCQCSLAIHSPLRIHGLRLQHSRIQAVLKAPTGRPASVDTQNRPLMDS